MTDDDDDDDDCYVEDDDDLGCDFFPFGRQAEEESSFGYDDNGLWVDDNYDDDIDRAIAAGREDIAARILSKSEGISRTAAYRRIRSDYT